MSADQVLPENLLMFIGTKDETVPTKNQVLLWETFLKPDSIPVGSNHFFNAILAAFFNMDKIYSFYEKTFEGEKSYQNRVLQKYIERIYGEIFIGEDRLHLSSLPPVIHVGQLIHGEAFVTIGTDEAFELPMKFINLNSELKTYPNFPIEIRHKVTIQRPVISLSAANQILIERIFKNLKEIEAIFLIGPNGFELYDTGFIQRGRINLHWIF